MLNQPLTGTVNLFPLLPPDLQHSSICYSKVKVLLALVNFILPDSAALQYDFVQGFLAVKVSKD